MSRTQTTRQLAVYTPLGDEVLMVRSMSMSDALSRLFQIDLVLRSEDPLIAYHDILGKNVTVSLSIGEAKDRYFNGFVSRFVQTGAAGGTTEYHATLVPWAWFLTRHADCRIFQKKTVPDIVKALLSEKGLTDVEFRLTGTYPEWEYCVQYRETDFNFISRLLEQEGIYYYFRHENGRHVMVLADAASHHVVLPEYEEIEFHPPDAVMQDREHITAWSLEQQLQPAQFSHGDFDWSKTSPALLSSQKTTVKSSVAATEVFDYPGEFDLTGEGDALAKVRMQEFESRFETASGSSDSRGITTGYKFKLTQYPREDQCKEYLITSVVIRAESDSFESGGGNGEGGGYTVSFTAIPAVQQFRPARVTPRPVISGCQTALVVGPSGKEIWTDEHGRVKVLFPWDRAGKADDSASCWIRVAQHWAGKGWGTMMIPRLGHEVVVEFLEGDPDRPLIVGRVYNAINKPPYKLPDKDTVTTSKSLTSPGGGGYNELRFEDKKDKEQVFLHSQRRMDLRVKANMYHTVGGNLERRVGYEDKGCHNEIVHENTNSLTKGHRYETVDKTLNQAVKEDVIHDHQMNHHLMVKDMIQINADKLVIEMKTSISEKSGKVMLEGTQELHLKGTKVFVTGTQELNLKGGNVNIQADQNVNIKGGMATNIEGGLTASMKAGASFFAAGPAGADISGLMVKINSGGSAGTAQAATAAGSADAFSEPTLTAPIEAYGAATALPGDMTYGKGGGRQNVAHKLVPQLAPPPPPPPPPPLVPGVPPPTHIPPPNTCSVQGLEVTCSHDGRKAKDVGGRLLLQIVPSKVVVRNKLGFGNISVEEARGFGSDAITARSTYGKVCGAHPELTLSGGSNKTVKALSLPFSAEPPQVHPFFSAFVEPRRYTLHAASCAGGLCEATIECYPSCSVSLEVDASAVTKKWAKPLVLAAEIYNAVKSSEDSDFKVKVAEGKVKATWGWKEEKNSHQVYFEVSPSIALDPILGFEGLRWKVSVANYIPSIIRDHVADVYAFIEFAGGVKVEIKGTARRYPTGKWKNEITGGVSGEVSVTLGLEAKAGAQEILQVKVGAVIKTKIEATSSVVLDDRQGLGIDLNTSHDGLKGEVYCKIKGNGRIDWFTTEKSAEVVFVKGDDIGSHKIWFFDET